MIARGINSPPASSLGRLGERPATLDVAPLIRAVVQDIHAAIGIAQIAERFHRSVAELLATACLRARARRAAWVLWR